MIDTVQIHTNVNIPQSTLNNLFNRKILSIKSYQDIDVHNKVYEVGGGLKEGIRIRYSPRKERLQFTASLPRLIIGTNLPLILDVDISTFLDTLNKELSELFDLPDLPHPGDWEVTRADYYYYNFFVGRDVETYLQLLSRVALPKLKTVSVRSSDGLETVYWFAATRGIKLRAYDKQRECREKKPFRDERFNDFVVGISEGVLRLEATYRSSQLREALEAASLPAKEVLTVDAAISLLGRYLDKINEELQVLDKEKLAMYAIRNLPPKDAEKVLVYIYTPSEYSDALLSRHESKTRYRRRKLIKKMEAAAKDNTDDGLRKLQPSASLDLIPAETPVAFIAVSPKGLKEPPYSSVDSDGTAVWRTRTGELDIRTKGAFLEKSYSIFA